MDLRHAPAVVPATAIVAGTTVASLATPVAPFGVALVAVLAVLWRRRAGVWLALFAAAWLNAELRWLAPVRRLASFDARRPVEIVARIDSHPVVWGDNPAVWASARELRQGTRTREGLLSLQLLLPPGLEGPSLGETVSFAGYLRRSAGYGNPGAPKVAGWRVRLKSVHLLEQREGAPVHCRLAAGLRRWVEGRLAAAERRHPGASVARALLLGDPSRLSPRHRRALARAGLSHLLAVSGLHVGLVGLLAYLSLGFLPRGGRLAAAAAATGAYLLLVGPRPSVLRAASMALLAVMALWMERPPQPLNALAWGVSSLVVIDPAAIAELGFQLSVAATAGILLLASCRQGADGKVGRSWAARALSASIGAQLATLPWIHALEAGVHPLASLLSLLALPWMAVVLAVSVVAGLPGAAPVAGALLEGLATPLEWLAALPASRWLFLPFTASVVERWGLVAAGWLALRRPRWAVGVVLAAGLVLGGDRQPEAAGDAEIVVFDVGQGESILLRDGPRALLIDGGGWPVGDLGGRVLVPALIHLGVRRLDAVALSHPDIDHCRGLLGVVERLEVGEVWSGGSWPRAPCAAELAAVPGPSWRVLWRDAVRRVGRWRLRTLWPPAGRRHGRNERSLVLVAEVAGTRILLTGDLEAAGELGLVELAGPGLAADILKVAHHGSKTSTHPSFLAAVAPRLAIVSAGRGNVYGHPAEAVTARLGESAVWLLRTDVDGMIRLRLGDRRRIAVERWRDGVQPRK